MRIRLISSPYFLGTKLEAFSNRGRGNFQESADIEDFVAVMDGRMDVVKEIAAADDDIKSYLSQKVKKLLASSAFLESLPGHLFPDKGSQGRLPLLGKKLRAIATL